MKKHINLAMSIMGFSSLSSVFLFSIIQLSALISSYGDLRKMDNHVLITMKNSNGDLVDCIDGKRQHASYNSLLKNHTIQNLAGNGSEIPKDETKSSLITEVSEVLLSNFTKCPNGSIPILRTTMNNDAMTTDLSKRKQHLSYHDLVNVDIAQEVAMVVIDVPNGIKGIQATMNVWCPTIEAVGEYSASEIQLVAGDGSAMNVVGAGWRVFGFWTRDGAENTGGFNLDVPGFVSGTEGEEAPLVYLGFPLRVSSIYEGMQIDIKFSIFKVLRNPLTDICPLLDTSIVMERYRILEELGDGTCGCVFKAIKKETNEIVAVKKIKRKFYFWEDCMSLREVKVLQKLNHPNIIKLNEVVRENNELFFVFEYMEYNLYQKMKDRERPFCEEEIRSFMSQLLQGLSHMHRSRYFHRDLKPENLLVTDNFLKIADFGLAREVLSMPPYTEYVSTRWYRAPEVLLQSPRYTPAIDMWAVGAILAELFTLSPLFPGESEADQLFKICSVLGAPDWTAITEATNMSGFFNIRYSDISSVNLADLLPNASSAAIDLIKKLCSWDPLNRPTADQALQHPFFHMGMWIPCPLLDPLELKLSNIGSKPNLELNLWDFSTEHDDCFLGLTLAVKPSDSNLELVHNKSRRTEEDILFLRGFRSHSEQSAFWSLLSAEDGHSAPVGSSLSLSFSSIKHPMSGIPQSSGYTVGPL